jgi:hypothetical protein
MCPIYLKLQSNLLSYFNGFRTDICEGIIPLYNSIELAAYIYIYISIYIIYIIYIHMLLPESTFHRALYNNWDF